MLAQGLVVELVVVDDASTVKTHEILTEIQNPFVIMPPDSFGYGNHGSNRRKPTQGESNRARLLTMHRFHSVD